MGLWQVPAKVLLPAEPDRSPAVFEFNGRLADGSQVMAYAQARHDRRGSANPPVLLGYTAVLFRFDADGGLVAVDFASADHDPRQPDLSYDRGRELLADLVQRVRAEGWESADIRVRPFYVEVDGLGTGLIYRTAGEDDGDEEYSAEEVRLVPFDKIFRRPWTDGEYST
jgi:hypothetical protein